ncbi:hypothetical protein BO70DRAFT_359601 [Aspergillus heteromorphus CBS 117.55]|uniref:GPI anchored protein n=1 Tax=Aspergillus heteromorphus CBS 117.55 TaxID=1448321 RepID=A0A317WYN2_9EURO|nr:uncharacterized protein BO70DRAFT_359601 [Aspergillus heteromorphus CBS 117.55]PWY89320.1 hypothetical protein BO70DRAFT_359601 [Aspergillus heteromorphus CBS 117.55]
MRFQLSSSLALLATISCSAVASDVVSIYWLDSDLTALDAKLVGTTGGALTTLIINCPATATASTTAAATTTSSGDDLSETGCNIPSEGYSLTVGSTTLLYTYSDAAITLSEQCSFAGTTSLSCAATSTIGSDVGSTTVTTSTELTLLPVTITATEGSKATGSAASASASSTASSSSTGTGASAKTTASGTSSSSSTSSSSATASSTSNGAMSLATGAQWVAGGAAMMLALAMA